MSDNYNINTTQAQSFEAGGIDPNDPSMPMADAMAKNRLNQQQQEQLVKQAVERTKQAKIGTTEAQTELDTEGYLAEKGQVKKEVALTDLQAALANSKDIPDEDKKGIMSRAEETWPEVVSADAVHRLVSALHESKPAKMGEGNPYKDKDGLWYQEIVDSAGKKYTVRSNEPASVTNHGASSDADVRKQWATLNEKVGLLVRAMRGSVVMNNIVRAKNGLELVYQYLGTNNVKLLASIEADVAAIMTGGVASETTLHEVHYATLARTWGEKLGYYTGKFNLLRHIPFTKVPPLNEIVEGLRNTLSSLLDASTETVKAQILLKETGYRELIESDSARWQKMVHDALAVASAGIPSSVYTPPADLAMGAPVPPVGGAPAPAAAPGGEQKTPGGHTFTVSE